MVSISLEDQSDWIQVCEIKNNELCFTKEYLKATKSLGGHARQFAAQLITHWDKNCASALDYFGPEDSEEDWYSGIDGEEMDVGESLPETWANNKIIDLHLSKEWYRNIMRAKLATIKLPKALIEEYVRAVG